MGPGRWEVVIWNTPSFDYMDTCMYASYFGLLIGVQHGTNIWSYYIGRMSLIWFPLFLLFILFLSRSFLFVVKGKKKEPDHNCKLIWVYNILDIYWMDHKAIEADVKNYKIREGPLYKRSKFLKEWRERWIVLTTNYLYTFTSKSLEEVTDILDLK